MCSWFHSIEWILIVYELNIETKYDTIKKFENSISATELVERHDVEKATIADIEKQKYTILKIMRGTYNYNSLMLATVEER